jgi:hypothetical protein
MRNQPLNDEARADIVGCADTLRSIARRRANLDLAYDDGSIRELAGFVESQRLIGDETSRKHLITVVGSFLGEAIIAKYGGAWVHHEQGLGIEFEDGSIGFPFIKTKKHFVNGLEDNIYGLYRNIPALRSPDASKTWVRAAGKSPSEELSDPPPTTRANPWWKIW